MDLQNLEKESQVIDFLCKLDYGSTYFISKNKNIILFLDNCLGIVNESIGIRVLCLVKEIDADMLAFKGYGEADGLYYVTSSREKKNLPVLYNDSFYLHKNLKKAFNNKCKISFQLNESLYNYAKKISKNKVLFQVEENEVFFHGSEKKKSIYDQIESAFHSGVDMIKFDSNVSKIATIRCYVSMISNMSGKKIKCSVINGFVVVQFKPLSKKDEIKNKINALLNEFDFEQERTDLLNEILNDKNYVSFSNEKQEVQISRDAIIPDFNEPFIYKLYGKPVSKDEYVSAANWQRSGFASQYNWENDIRGDVDMFPKDVRFEPDNEIDNEDESNDDGWD